MRDEEKPHIRRLPLFREMMTQTFDGLMQVAYSQSFPPGLELFRQGETADFLHIVIEGAVELQAQWNGQETVMGVVRPVSAFILAACVRNVPYLMSARTLEKSHIVLLPVADLRAAMRRDPDLAMAAMAELAGSYRSMVRHAKNLKLRNARERLAAWILTQANGAPAFMLPVEKRHLASYLGITPESLSRTLRALEPHGVRVDGARIIITDAERLRAFARPDPLID
ncbi:helix-turn-helix domain-containing protein [Ruixingdingia sedimenti]|uniref:Helix-turn-helix domain-containing protein n=1 Tax=Ruixingdingia sedimenti TaxID=3073604 RepID=A0ABU1F8E9_9RHOB|nr:helix-turn-helix domain-containing protein [Xinfangfangia sp. LG-4]MDR5653146.1 helix-turn-helix domain-containing protein [Xinfangfangia sp. LG-4]